MDALSEVLRAVKLDSAVYLNGEFGSPWSFQSPEARTFAGLVAPGAQHLVIYHLVLDGEVVTNVEGGERVRLGAGEIVAFPHGHAHFLGDGRGGPTMSALDVIPGVLARGLELARGGGGGETSRLICGYVSCDRQMAQTFLAGVPPLIKVSLSDDDSSQWLESTIRFSAEQAAKREPGAEALLTKLSEALFAQMLRLYVRGLPTDETGWLAGTRDASVGRALTLIHQRPAEPWTVADLAREVGTSRTVLTARFKHFLGEPPLAYLTRWRLRLGERALTSTGRSVAQIAYEVGYESEASFNRAFKRAYGIPPGRFRRVLAAVAEPDAGSSTPGAAA